MFSRADKPCFYLCSILICLDLVSSCGRHGPRSILASSSVVFRISVLLFCAITTALRSFLQYPQNGKRYFCISLSSLIYYYSTNDLCMQFTSQCWSFQPSDRPTFESLRRVCEDLLSALYPPSPTRVAPAASASARETDRQSGEADRAAMGSSKGEEELKGAYAVVRL